MWVQQLGPQVVHLRKPPGRAKKSNEGSQWKWLSSIIKHSTLDHIRKDRVWESDHSRNAVFSQNTLSSTVRPPVLPFPPLFSGFTVCKDRHTYVSDCCGEVKITKEYYYRIGQIPESIENYCVNRVTVAVTACLKQFQGEHDLVWLNVSVHHSRKSVDSQSHQLMEVKKPIKGKKWSGQDTPFND